jgi:predicted DNA-binding transcriptional regulator AlpA
VDRFLDQLEQRVESTIARALDAHAKTVVQSAQCPATPAPSPTPPWLELKPGEGGKAADLRIALLMGKIPETTGLLIDVKVLGKLLNVSTATLWRSLDGKTIPAPVRLGQLRRWRLAEILEWIDADCPPQHIWAGMRQQWLKRK